VPWQVPVQLEMTGSLVGQRLRCDTGMWEEWRGQRTGGTVWRAGRGARDGDDSRWRMRARWKPFRLGEVQLDRTEPSVDDASSTRARSEYGRERRGDGLGRSGRRDGAPSGPGCNVLILGRPWRQGSLVHRRRGERQAEVIWHMWPGVVELWEKVRTYSHSLFLG
jgi:hypothetical protein